MVNDLNSDALRKASMHESIKQDSSHAISDNTLKPISIQFKEARERMHLSQEEFSQKIGISNVQLSRIEQSKCRPSISTICSAAPYIGSDLETLLLSASYSGKIDSQAPIYLDLAGKPFDLKLAVQQMYSTDGELFSLLKDFYTEFYQREDAESLKIMLRTFKINKEMKKDEKHFSLFLQLYKALKSILASINIFMDSVLVRESI